jgi:hypothetical protein
MSMIEIRIPDIGDFKDVPIIEVHVSKRGRRQTLRGGSLRARLNGPACVDAWRLGCRKVMADQAAGAAV